MGRENNGGSDSVQTGIITLVSSLSHVSVLGSSPSVAVDWRGS